MSLRIVIVNYRTAALAVDCLRSLAPQVAELGDCRVTVVDNFSPDDSAARLQEAIASAGWNSWARCLPLQHNGGFAAGNNAAIRVFLAEQPPVRYVLLLNPDTIVHPGALRQLLDFMEIHPEVGLAGSRLEDPDGTPVHSAFRFPTIASELDRGFRLGLLSRLLHRYAVAPPVQDEPHPADWVAGASLLVRREVFHAVGLLDERYFLYYEETDFCLQARRAGWPCWYVPQSRIMHLEGQASGVVSSAVKKGRTPSYLLASRQRYFTKNHGWLYRVLADVAWTAGFACWRLRRLVQRKPDQDPPGLLWDFIRFNFLGMAPR